LLYAEKKQEEPVYVSVNTIAGGRVLELEKTAGETASPQQTKEQENTLSSGMSTQPAKAGTEAATPEENPSRLLEILSGLVRNIPGYNLLALALGRDPLTGETVKGDGLAWGKAIAGLLPGGAALFANLEKAGVLERAVAWFKEEIQKLGLSFAAIKNLFTQAWEAIVGTPSRQEETAERKSGWLGKAIQAVKQVGATVVSIGKALLSPGEAFNKIKEIFLPPIQRVIAFLGKAGPKLMEFLFEGALVLANAPVQKIMEVINKGKNVLLQIISDPIGFLKNLLQAVHGGLQNFLERIGIHLQAGLANWLFGTLSGIGIILPEKLDLAGIFSLIAQILEVTWQAIKAKVIKLLGPAAERVIEQIEKTVAVIANFITRGPIALYEMAVEFIGDLRDRFFASIIEWIRNTIIVKGVQKLISMFTPVGAVIQAIITIGNTIKFFIDRAKEIVAFTNAVFDSIAEIAAGNLKKAILYVENSLAKAISPAISFLASLAGIGGIVAKIKDVIKKIRRPIDRAVEKVVTFVADKVKALLGRKEKPAATEEKESPEKTEKLARGLTAIDEEERKYLENNRISRENAEKVAVAVKQAHPVFKSLTVVDGGDSWDYEYAASPVRVKEGPGKAEEKAGEEYSGELTALYKDELSKAPDETRPIIIGEITSQTEKLKKLKSWQEICEKIAQSGKLQPIYKKPLSKTHAFGERVQEQVAIPALREVEKDKTIEEYRRSIWARENAIHNEEMPYGPGPLKKLRTLIFNWLDHVNDAIKVLIKAFTEAKTWVGLSSKETRVVEELEKLNIQGAKTLANRIRTTRNPQFRAGLVIQAERAFEYHRQGALLAIEAPVAEGARCDLLIREFGKIGAEETRTIVEVKYWPGFSRMTQREKEKMIDKMDKQLKKYMATGKPVILEWYGKLPPEVEEKLKDLREQGLRIREI
jgi:hypothetical protein